jgi:hypothetical protein
LLALVARRTLAQPPNQAALIIRYADGSTSTHCIDLDQEPITGLELLQRSGVDLVYAGGNGGAQICKIGPDGCDNPANCFCQCQGTDCLYWSYWHLVDGMWQYAVAGASLYRIQPGAVDGWVWGIGTPSQAPEPPPVTFADICQPPTPTPTNTAPPTPSPIPATATSQATSDAPSPTPTATRATPTAPPTATASPTIPPTPAARGSGSGSYVAFGGIALALILIAAWTLRRRRTL